MTSCKAVTVEERAALVLNARLALSSGRLSPPWRRLAERVIATAETEFADDMAEVLNASGRLRARAAEISDAEKEVLIYLDKLVESYVEAARLAAAFIDRARAPNAGEHGSRPQA